MSNMKPDYWSYLVLVIGYGTEELHVVVHLFGNKGSHKRENAFIVDERIILHVPFLPLVCDSGRVVVSYHKDVILPTETYPSDFNAEFAHEIYRPRHIPWKEPDAEIDVVATIRKIMPRFD
jgi:hypothetical protein